MDDFLRLSYERLEGIFDISGTNVYLNMKILSQVLPLT